MHTKNKITRRSLAKRIVMTSAAAALPSSIPSSSVAKTANARMTAAWSQVHPGIWRATIGKPEALTPVSERIIPPQVSGFEHLPLVSAIPLPAPAGTVTERGTVFELPLRPNELVYGLGLQFLSFGQRGKKKTIRVNADPKFDTGDSHAPVPFYVTTEGIGVFVDTARYATFYMGDARPKPDRPVTTVSNANPDPNYTHNIESADRGRITVEVPHASGVDVYLFAGPTMLDVVRRFNIFSGGGVMPPEWGLGFWYRSEARATDQSAAALAKEFRDRSVPCDVFGLEPGWQTHAYSCTFVWDPKRFPDPARFIKDVQEMNYKVNLWEHAFTHPASPIFGALEPKSGSHGVWGGLVPDFADLDARQIFGDYHGKTFVEAGISGFKLDECDNSDYTGGWSFPELSQFRSGLDGEQMHNLFGLRYQDAIWEEYRKRNLQTYGLVRSSGALAAPYPFVLYSDLYNHRDFIRALVNSGFSGLLWCPEVRDAISEEDLLRRLQSVVFSPLAMVNGWYIKSPPWRQLNRRLNNAGEDMTNWQATEMRCKEIIGWRMSLVPYLMAAFQQYATDGTPPFRALVLDHARDPRVANVDDQYLIGDRMMVAPLFAGEAQRKVAIPAGDDWHDFWSGAIVQAGSTITVASSFERIPVYVKAGTVIPWSDVGLHAGASESRRVAARVYGDGSRSFTFAGERGARLRWSGGRGSVDGRSGYDVYAWHNLG
jgi:alpha-D-xyloside xylohydrolase